MLGSFDEVDYTEFPVEIGTVVLTLKHISAWRIGDRDEAGCRIPERRRRDPPRRVTSEPGLPRRPPASLKTRCNISPRLGIGVTVSRILRRHLEAAVLMAGFADNAGIVAARCEYKSDIGIS